MTRFAFVGFRHAHILSMLQVVQTRPDTEVVALCETNDTARAEIESKVNRKIDFQDYRKMIDEVDCDVIAVGDYFARRGEIVIASLEADKSVISDKPICTTLTEFDRIEALAKSNGLLVGCMLDMRGSAAMVTLRNIIQEGRLGEIHTIAFGGQHPLGLTWRDKWFFEPGLHGGAINDIGVHGIDLVRWLTGHDVNEVTAARCWNAKAKPYLHFKDGAQFMMKLDNGAGIMADVSYLAPDKLGYHVRQYWRFTIHGERGMAETHHTAKNVLVVEDSDKQQHLVPTAGGNATSYFEDFLAEQRGETTAVSNLSTADGLRATRVALVAQKMADSNDAKVPV